MFLYHATPRKNRPSIDKRGLLRSFSQTAGEGIWLHDWNRRRWAIGHVAKRHGVDPDDVHVYLVYVNPRHVVKHSSGVYIAYVNIPAAAMTEPTSPL